jgi:uncharacterized protein YndB with AHSA1/START domain
MTTLVEEIRIDMPVRRVFRLAARPENMPRWNSAVLESELHGRLAEGAVVLQRIHLLGRRFATEFRVTRYEPPSRITYTSTLGPMDIEGTMEFTSASGGTQVRWTVTGSSRHFLRVADGMLLRVGRREMRSCLGNLKRFVEQAGPASATRPRRRFRTVGAPVGVATAAA